MTITPGATGQVIIFDTEVLDFNGDYNEVTGKFTGECVKRSQ